MIAYEYKVLPAPAKGRKAPGIKGPEAQFVHRIEQLMNEMGADGWDYQRADILPSEERQGLTSSHIVHRSILVFRRALPQDQPETPVSEVMLAVASDTPEAPEAIEDPQPEPNEDTAAPAEPGDPVEEPKQPA